MRLDGHEKEVLCVKISPDGQTLASAGMDKLLLIWSVFGSCENTAVCGLLCGSISYRGYRFVEDILYLFWKSSGRSTAHTSSRPVRISRWAFGTLRPA